MAALCEYQFPSPEVAVTGVPKPGSSSALDLDPGGSPVISQEKAPEMGPCFCFSTERGQGIIGRADTRPAALMSAQVRSCAGKDLATLAMKRGACTSFI